MAGKTLVIAVSVSLVLAAAAGVALAKEPVNQSALGGIAIRGIDPVAYFTDGKPAKGNKKFEVEWNGAKWRFGSAEHRDLFKADPEKYAPQYGGYCAWAVSQGYTASIDPQAWRIVDGKLYLNYSLEVQATWETDILGFIRLADGNYPGIVAGR